VQARINPAFHRFPDEAAIVGRLLAAFGELEFNVLANAGRAINLQNSLLRSMYRLRTTSTRLDASDALIRPVCDQFKMKNEYELSFNSVKYCLKIRNQFSHCYWGDDLVGGLFFIDLEEAFKDAEDNELHWRHVDTDLLAMQEAYFVYTLESLRYVNHELAARRGFRQNSSPRPPKLEKPPLHNPPSEHIPPWLNEEQQALYLARAAAARDGAPTPTPKQQALDKAREAKRAQKQADRKRSAAKRATPDS
jgi:hypothetical protein